MTSGVHAHHGTGAGGPAPDGMDELAGDPHFQQLLSQTARSLGAEEGELMLAMHEAEALVDGRDDMSEDEKLAVMMDFITDRFSASDLTDDEMMQLMELCRMCLGAWQDEAAAEEGYVIVRTERTFEDPMAGLLDLIGNPAEGRPEPDAFEAPKSPPLRRVDREEEDEEDEENA